MNMVVYMSYCLCCMSYCFSFDLLKSPDWWFVSFWCFLFFPTVWRQTWLQNTLLGNQIIAVPTPLRWLLWWLNYRRQQNFHLKSLFYERLARMSLRLQRQKQSALLFLARMTQICLKQKQEHILPTRSLVVLLYFQSHCWVLHKWQLSLWSFGTNSTG